MHNVFQFITANGLVLRIQSGVFIGARVEDSGNYGCSVPVLDEFKRVDVFVICKSKPMLLLCVYVYVFYIKFSSVAHVLYFIVT